jgi:hypothetical protein
MINHGLMLGMCTFAALILREAIGVYREEKSPDAYHILVWSSSITSGAFVAFVQERFLHYKRLTPLWHVISDAFLDGMMLLAIYQGLAFTIELTDQDGKMELKRSIGKKLCICWPLLIVLYFPYRFGYGQIFYHLYNGVRLLAFILFIQRSVFWYRRQAQRTNDFMTWHQMTLMKTACYVCILYPLLAPANPERFSPRPDLIIANIAGGLFYFGYVTPEWFQNWLKAGSRPLLDDERLRSHLALAGVVSDFENPFPMNRYFLEHCILRFSEGLGLAEKDQDLIIRASYLLDAGRIPHPSIPSDGEMTDEAISQRSADFAGETLRLHRVERILRHAHEWWDGSGYPEGLVGEQIPFHSRVLALANAFAGELFMHRDSHLALDAVRGRSSEFDPQLFVALEEMVVAGRFEM